MANWIKCMNTKEMPVYINLDNAVTVMRDDSGQRIKERGNGDRVHGRRAGLHRRDRAT